ncbi:hypothetical protein [Polyangium spumosum]|uniref:Uncharacterized protein n=1 Tax=Polyangium spumosum TaxID=889282 RepID=A0A6N7Q5N6_9BACT|nr:hypothetical protein [Polyangium spumosum]MRG98200.1 hypothetical protein [Polyangium spumosum]
MSFTRIKPGGWAVNEKLTSAQQNQLDIDHANAVDKTGDTVEGLITFQGGGGITIATGGFLTISGGSLNISGAGNSINLLSGASLTTDATSPVSFGGTLSVAGATTLGALTVNGITALNGATTVTGALTTSNTVTANGAVTTNSTLTTNDPVTHNDSVTCNSGLVVESGVLDLRPGAGALVEAGASLVHANLSNQTYQSGAVCTYQSGSSLTLNSGSTASIGGQMLFASGSTPLYNNGSSTTVIAGATWAFNNTPTFAAGLTVNGGTISHGVATTTNLAGTTTIAGSSNRLRLTSRDVTRVYDATNAVPSRLVFGGGGNQSPTVDTLNGFTILTAFDGSLPQEIAITLSPPHGSTLKTVRFSWAGTGSPGVTLSVLASGSTLASVSTTTTGDIDLSPDVVVDRVNQTYRARLRYTTGTVDGTVSLLRVTTICTVSEYDEG